MKYRTALYLLVALVAINNTIVYPQTGGGNPTATNAGTSITTDTSFISKNIRDNMMEIQMSQMGIDRGSSTTVKNAARQMLVDHRMILGDLARASRKYNMDLAALGVDMQMLNNANAGNAGNMGNNTSGTGNTNRSGSTMDASTGNNTTGTGAGTNRSRSGSNMDATTGSNTTNAGTTNNRNRNRGNADATVGNNRSDTASARRGGNNMRRNNRTGTNADAQMGTTGTGNNQSTGTGTTRSNATGTTSSAGNTRAATSGTTNATGTTGTTGTTGNTGTTGTTGTMGTGTSGNTTTGSAGMAMGGSMDMTALQTATGAEFDRMWISQMLTMHEAKLAELTNASAAVRDTDLQTAVTRAIPKIRMHRDILQRLQTGTQGTNNQGQRDQ